MLGRKPQTGYHTVNSTLEKEINLLENFSTICVNKCINSNEIERDLAHGEKACIGKCLDRGYEYLRIV